MRSNISKFYQNWWFPITAIAVVAAAVVFRAAWWPALSNWVAETTNRKPQAADSEKPHSEEHDHAHGDGHAHDDATSIELSPQARRNVGLDKEALRPLQLETYRRHITVPAVVVERPGRTRVQISTPLTGIVTRVHAVEGETVEPGELLFEIRLTHEDLVETQTEFLKTLGELDIEQKEFARLKGIADSGAIAGKLVLEREYSINKLKSLLNSQREALRLHGLSEEKITKIESDRRLAKSLQIRVPSPDGSLGDEFDFTSAPIQKVTHLDEKLPPLIVRDLHVQLGQSIIAGETLCELADFSELYVEGRAFERDGEVIANAVKRDWKVDAIIENNSGLSEVKSLMFGYVSNVVDPNSRTLSFYVNLPNQIVRDERNDKGQRFISWKFRPGQRLQLRVPVEEWEKQFVLPVDAVSREGAESFVFQENGDHFDRIPVHVKYRDQMSVVIANDGTLFPGDVVARRGAHQLQMALKNKSGAGVDPHAGHNH